MPLFGHSGRGLGNGGEFESKYDPLFLVLPLGVREIFFLQSVPYVLNDYSEVHSKNIATQVLVLDQRIELLIDIGHVDRDAEAGFVGGLER